MINIFDKIISVEVNPYFIESWKKKSWYLYNKNKIEIYILCKSKAEDIYNFVKSNSINITFMNHVLYHVLLSDIKYKLLPRFQLLLKKMVIL